MHRNNTNNPIALQMLRQNIDDMESRVMVSIWSFNSTVNEKSKGDKLFLFEMHWFF